jgi:hypothetical protein
MAETEMFMYAVTAGVFIFLAGILFGTRAKRPHGHQSIQTGMT